MAYIEPPHKDQILSLIKESKRLERKEKFLEALSVLDRISHLHESKLIDFSLSTALTKQIATLCNRLVITVQSKVPYLRRAEQTLISWILMMHSSKVPMNEKIYRIILLTYNNWATYYQSTKNYHMTLSYLMKGLKLIEDCEIKEADSFEYVAKTQLNVCALYSELRRYNDAILYAEECLKTLQCEVKLRLANKDFNKLENKEKAKAESMFVTYVIAFYNIGVAEEYLNHKESMFQAFTNAVNIGTPFLHPDNEYLISAKKALNEALIYKTKLSSPIGARSSIRIPPDQLAQKIKKHTKNKYSLTIHKAEKKLNKPELQKNDEKKRIGRYYSDAQLKKIQEKLEANEKNNFVSVDQYFYREISKLMNVKSDVQFLRPLTTIGAMNLWDKQDEEKLRIAGLREKKKKIKVGEFLRHKISEKIQKMKEIDDQFLKKQEIKLKSKMKTKVYKNLLRAITDRTYNYSFPPQRIL